MNGEVLYSRWEHGARKIEDLGGTYQMPDDEGLPRVFGSRRQLLMYLYKGRDLHLPFDRYFRIGKYSPMGQARPTLAPNELCVIQDAEIIVDKAPHRAADPGSAATRSKVELGQITVGPTPVLGIDLARRGHEVEKLMYKGFGGEISRAGYDPDDVLQEIYRGILSRNQGRCPFDSRKSSFSHYVYMVCRCVIRNIHRAESRRRERESVGIRTRGEDTDVASSDSLLCQAGLNTNDDLDTLQDFKRWVRSQARGRTNEGQLACQIIPYLYQGLTIKEIALQLERAPYQISRAIRYLRSLRSAWCN